jgi:hypothetical protein
VSELESERLCIGGPYDGQRFMLRDGQAASPFMNEEAKAVWYRSDPDDPTQAIYSGPEFDGMDAEGSRRQKRTLKRWPLGYRRRSMTGNDGE